MKPNLVLLICTLLFAQEFFGQTYVTWNPASANTAVSGGWGGSTWVTATLTGTGNSVAFYSPAIVQNPSLVVAGANTFGTRGPAANDPSMSLIFTFSVPVIVTRYNMDDIDRSNNLWDDSFNFANISFTTSASTGCNATLNGAVATGDPAAANAFWTCSNAISTFTVNYATTAGLTDAYLGYSMEVLTVPTIAPICLNDVGTLPATIGNGITGTWSQIVIDSSVAGTFPYTFTPDLGQALTCPLTIDVTILPENNPGCCPITLNLTSLLGDDVLSGTVNHEVQQTIFAANIINAGTHAVYHGDYFIELKPGFEAVAGAEFAAYIAGCTGTPIYRTANSNVELPQIGKYTANNKFIISPNPSKDYISINALDLLITNILITSLDGRTILNRPVNKESTEIDVSNYPNGVYFISVETPGMKTMTEKFIKN